jgi:peptide/nickel transport system substrate-binding protein
VGQGEPWHPVPFKDSRMYHEGIATQYLEFDPEQANALLDGLGLTERNAEGIRLMKSGKPVQFAVELTELPASRRDQLELMAIQWRENLGVQMTINVWERGFLESKMASNDHNAHARDENTSWLPGRPPAAQVPVSADARWARAW